MSKFTRSHYETIALAMQESCPAPGWGPTRRVAWESVRSSLCDVFEYDNNRFDRGRFMAACEKGANVRART